MTKEEFVSEIKVYLKIKDTDIDNDPTITQVADATNGFIIANYSYYIVDATVVQNLQLEGASKKFWLNSGPAKTVTAELNDTPVMDNTIKLINNIAYFEDAFGVAGDFLKLTSEVGLSATNPQNMGDVAQACALAAYFYKQADKGLDGVMQYGTGIKESARLFEGIPKGITGYFEARKLFRL